MGNAWTQCIEPALTRIGGFMPVNLARLREAGVDLRQRQEWIPAVQSLRGGVRIGSDGQSDLPGLFAAGMAEALDPGLFNGWSTLRAMGSGERSGRGAARYLRDAGPADPSADESEARVAAALAPLSRSKSGAVRAEDVTERMQRVMFRPDVGVRKRGEALAAALREIEDLRGAALPDLAADDAHGLVKLHETRSIVLAAEMFLRASLAREDSCGAHFRVEHPKPAGSGGLAWVNLRRGEGGAMQLERERVPLEAHPIQPEPAEARA